MLNNNYIIKYRKGLTLMEMVLSLAIIIVVAAVMLPQLSAIQKGWESRQCGSEALQNGRVLVDHINRNLAKAVKVTDVSASTVEIGYIEFVGNDGNDYRYEVSAENIVQFGVVGSLSDLAGPVTKFQITCYDDQDLDTPLDIAVDGVDDIRFVKADITFVNSSELGQDKDLLASVYLRTSASSEACLFAHWTFDETSGITANDSGGGDYHGTLNNMVGVVASGLLAVAMVPILRGLTAAHFGATVIERKTRSLALAQAKLDEIKVRSVYDYLSTYVENDTSLDGAYLCSVSDTALGANLRNITVEVGYDEDGDSTLHSSEVIVTLDSLIARRW